MRRVGLAAAAVLLLVGMAVYYFDWPSVRIASADKLPTGAAQSGRIPVAKHMREFNSANSRPVEHDAPGVALLPDAERLANRLNAPDATAEDDIEVLQIIFATFRSANGGMNPAGGLNEEVMDGLRGKNPRRIAAFPQNHLSIDAQGRLLDRWSTPYFFHAVSGKLLEVGSAGPDRKFWTEDDLKSASAGQ